MAMQWLDDVRQTATLDEAEQLAVRLMQSPFQEVRASYARVNFDVATFAAKLSESVREARKARSARKVAQNRYELESTERREAVEAAAKWIVTLQLAGRCGSACVGGQGICRLAAHREQAADQQHGAPGDPSPERAPDRSAPIRPGLGRDARSRPAYC